MPLLSLTEMSLCASLVIAGGAILRLCLGRRLPASCFLFLWKLAILRLLLPLAIPLPESVSSHQPADRLLSFFPEQWETPAVTVPPSSTILVLPDASASASSFSWIAVVWPLCWSAGALCLALFLLLRHLRWRCIYREALPADVSLPPFWSGGVDALCRPVIRESDRISGPLTYGIVHPVILLPCRLPSGMLPGVLAHEWTHIRRADNLFQWLMAAALCLHWSNPLVWLLAVLFTRDMELSCDEAVIRNTGPSGRKRYALTLLLLEESRCRVLPLTAGFSKHPIAERMDVIMKPKSHTLAHSVLTAGILVGAIALLTAAGLRSAQAAPTAQPDVPSPPPLAQAEQPVDEESSTTPGEMTTVLHSWATAQSTEEQREDARLLSEFALTLYGIPDGGSLQDCPALQEALQNGRLDIELSTALSQKQSEDPENSPYTHLLLCIAAGDICPALREVGEEEDGTVAEMAGVIYQAFVDIVSGSVSVTE